MFYWSPLVHTRTHNGGWSTSAISVGKNAGGQRKSGEKKKKSHFYKSPFHFTAKISSTSSEYGTFSIIDKGSAVVKAIHLYKEKVEGKLYGPTESFLCTIKALFESCVINTRSISFLFGKINNVLTGVVVFKSYHKLLESCSSEQLKMFAQLCRA